LKEIQFITFLLNIFSGFSFDFGMNQVYSVNIDKS